MANFSKGDRVIFGEGLWWERITRGSVNATRNGVVEIICDDGRSRCAPEEFVLVDEIGSQPPAAPGA
jgi:hypothetical protein